jgi:aminopeptidase N
VHDRFDISRVNERWSFARTKIAMSSYLVAFSVGQFSYVEQQDRGVHFRIYTPPNEASYGTFALNVSVRTVQLFDKWFGLPYSQMNSKMDQIAAPGK